jgi:hypothetical protein
MRWLFCLTLLALTVPNSGCLAAAITGAAVGAGAAGFAYHQGAVPRDFPATMDQTWSATQLALADLGMPIVSAERDNDGATIESKTGDGQTIKISLEPRAARVPADGQWTHITVRVAWFGDGPLSERVLNQIDARLGLPPGQPAPGLLQAQPAPPNETAAPPLAP